MREVLVEGSIPTLMFTRHVVSQLYEGLDEDYCILTNLGTNGTSPL